jgi:hypothetical protein
MPLKLIGTVELTDSCGVVHIACQFRHYGVSSFSCGIHAPRTTSIWRLRNGRLLTTNDEFTFVDLEGRGYELLR